MYSLLCEWHPRTTADVFFSGPGSALVLLFSSCAFLWSVSCSVPRVPWWTVAACAILFPWVSPGRLDFHHFLFWVDTGDHFQCCSRGVSRLVGWCFALYISVVHSHLTAFTQLQPSLAHWFFLSLKTSLSFCKMLLGLASPSFQMQLTATQVSPSPHHFYQTPNPLVGWSTYRGHLASVSESGAIPCSCQFENSQVPLHSVRQ